MPLRAGGPAADVVKRPPKRGATSKTFQADIKRRKARAKLFAVPASHAFEADPKSVYRTREYLARTPSPRRYYTKKEIMADPQLRMLDSNRRAAIASLRSEKFDRTNVERTQKLLGMTGLPGSRKVGQIVGGLGVTAAYTPAGLYHLATTSPKKTVPELARATVDPIRHPRRYWRDDPAALILSGYGLAAGGTSIAARGAAAARAGSGRAALKAALRRPGGGMRTIYHDGEQTQALATRSALGSLLGKASDRALGLDRPDAWTTRRRQGKVTKPAEYRDETTMLPNPERRNVEHRAKVAQAHVDTIERTIVAADKAAERATGKPSVTTRGVEAVPRTHADVEARLKAIKGELEPALVALRKYYRDVAREQKPLTEGPKKKGDAYMTEADKATLGKRGRFTGTMRVSGSRAADEEALLGKAGVDPTKVQVRTGRGFKQMDVYAEAEKILDKLGGRKGADPRLRRLRSLLHERDSLAALQARVKGAESGLFPEDMPAGGLGVDLRFTSQRRGKAAHATYSDPSAAATRLREAAARARAGLPGARKALADALAEVEKTPAQTAAQRRRLVSAEERKAPPPDIARPGRALARWAAGHKFRSEKMQQDALRLAEELATYDVRARQTSTRRVVRSMNRMSRVLLLYAKLGYVPSNIVSQELFSLMQQGWRVPYNRVASAQLRGTRFGEAARKAGVNIADPIRDPQALKDFAEAAGSGRVRSGMAPHPDAPVSERMIGHAEEGLIRLDETLGRVYGAFVDNPYRGAALVHEFRKQGIKPRDIERMLKAAGAHSDDAQQAMRWRGPIDPRVAREANRAVNEASRRAKRAVIDYGRMGKGFKNIRDLVFVAPWVKGATHYTLQFPLEHPALTVAMSPTSRVGREHTGISPRQPYMTAGSFKVGERETPLGPMPLVVNPNYVNPWKQPFDTGRALASFVPQLTGVHASRYNSIFDVMQPLIGEAGAEVAREGSPTGWGILGNFLKGTPPYRLGEGVMHPATSEETFRLYPRNQMDAINAWVLGSIAPKAQNPVKTEALYRQEVSAGKSKREIANLHADWLKGDVRTKLNQLRAMTGKAPLTDGQFKGIASQADMIHRHAIARIDVKRDYPEFHARGKKNTLDDRGELLAAIAALIGDTPDGPAKIAQIAEGLRRIPADQPLPASAKRSVRGGLENEYRLKALVKKLNEATAATLPYTQGGAGITPP